MAIHSSILAWGIPPTEKPGGLQSLGQEDPLEEEMAIHSSFLAWEIPWTENPGGLLSMESQSQKQLNMHTQPIDLFPILFFLNFKEFFKLKYFYVI